MGVLVGKSIEEWLKSRDFRLGGVHHGGWWTPFFVLFNAADNMAIGAKLYYHAKVGSFRDSIRVLRDSIGVSVIVWSFACLYAKFVTFDI